MYGFAANEGIVLVGESGQATATFTLGETAVKNEANVFTGTHPAKTIDDADRDNLRVLGVKDGTTVKSISSSQALHLQTSAPTVLSSIPIESIRPACLV